MMGKPQPAEAGKHHQATGPQRRQTTEEDEEKNNRLNRENAEERRSSSAVSDHPSGYSFRSALTITKGGAVEIEREDEEVGHHQPREALVSLDAGGSRRNESIGYGCASAAV
jgi:hypothetical protein